MIQVRRGHTRWVLLVGRWAIKVARPSMVARGDATVLGMRSNLTERRLSLAARGDPRLAETVWCSTWDIVTIQQQTINKPLARSLTDDERWSLPLRDFHGAPDVDDKPGNVFRRADGDLLVVDYGNCAMYEADA